MWTIIWICFTTIVGYTIGDVFFKDINHAGIIGAAWGFFLGIVIRYAPTFLDDIGDVF